MSEQSDHEFTKSADACMHALFAKLTNLDPDEVDADLAAGVMTLEFADGRKFILNRQTAAHQIWLAHGVTAYHFAREPDGRWMDTKGRGELAMLLARAISQKLGRPVTL